MRFAGAPILGIVSFHGGLDTPNPDSGSDPSSGVAYNKKADKRSWEHMKIFFAELFK